MTHQENASLYLPLSTVPRKKAKCQQSESLGQSNPGQCRPATALPLGLLTRLFRFHPSFTVLLDDHPAGKIGNEQMRVFEVEPGEHRLRIRFVELRKSKELRISLKDAEERQFLCGANGFGWPTLREASAEDLAEIQGSSISEPPKPEDPTSQN